MDSALRIRCLAGDEPRDEIECGQLHLVRRAKRSNRLTRRDTLDIL